MGLKADVDWMDFHGRAYFCNFQIVFSAQMDSSALKCGGDALPREGGGLANHAQDCPSL